MPEHELSLKFVNGSDVHFVLSELASLLRRRDSLAAVALLVALLSVIPFELRSTLPAFVRPVIAVIDVGLFALLFLGSLLTSDFLRHPLGLQGIWEPVLTLFSSTITTLATLGCMVLFWGDTPVNAMEGLIAVLLYYVFWEGLVTILFLFILPAIRLQRDMAPVYAEPPAELPPYVLQLGQVRLPKDQVRRIESSDHYLTVHTDSGTARTLARLSEAEAQLHDHGMIVHRSHWVAHRQFKSLFRDGRRIMLSLQSGDSVPVSRERKAFVSMILTQRGNVL